MDSSLKYIGEGNAHVVLEIVNSNFVLRLIKENGKTADSGTIQDSVNFVNRIMSPLLFQQLVEPYEIISFQKSEVIKIRDKIQLFRPDYRKIKSLFSSTAIKAPNLTIVSAKFHTNYCLEIKPKEGFMANNLKRYSKCYYCLKQFLKLKDNKIDSVSGYCPLNFFSGDELLMKRSLLNLIKNPQNNLKFFKNGNLIYGDKLFITDFDSILGDINIFKGKINLFLNSMIAILLSSPHRPTFIEESSINMTELNVADYCTEKNKLETNNLLHNLLEIQKLSDIPHDSEEMSTEGTEYVSLLLQLIDDKKLNLQDDKDRKLLYSICNHNYLALVAAVAKDCSIMISFSEEFEDGVPTIQIGNQRLSYKLAVTDLEPKSAKTLAKRKKTEAKLIEIYERYVKNRNQDNCKYQQRIQPHTETRAKQLEAWQHLIADYLKATKQSTIDIRESQNSPLFNNPAIKRKLSQEAILTILEDMSKNGRAEPVDKSKVVWEVYWHSLDEWGNMIYNWASSNGLSNAVCTIFEIREGENTVDEEFHGLDTNVLIKALKALQLKGKCELMEFDDNQGVKFF